MRSFIFIVLMLFSLNAYAGQYISEDGSGNVVELVYVEGSNDSFADFVEAVGLKGRPVIRRPVDLPPLADRKYWKLNDVPLGPRVIVDDAKKQTDLNQKAADEAAADASLQKMCPSCNRQDFKNILKVER